MQRQVMQMTLGLSCCTLGLMPGRDLDVPAPGDHPLIVIAQ